MGHWTRVTTLDSVFVGRGLWCGFFLPSTYDYVSTHFHLKWQWILSSLITYLCTMISWN